MLSFASSLSLLIATFACHLLLSQLLSSVPAYFQILRLPILPLFATASLRIHFLLATFYVLLPLDGAVAFALLLPLLLL